MDSDILVFSAAVFFVVGFAGLVVGFPDAGEVIGDGDPVYTVDGSIVVSGTSDGAEIKEGSFNYDTRESRLGLSFAGPVTDFSWTGAQNVDVDMVLRDKSTGEVVARDSEHFSEISALSEETVDFKFSRVPEGDYSLEFDINFECSFGTIGCENRDSYTADVLVPR